MDWNGGEIKALKLNGKSYCVLQKTFLVIIYSFTLSGLLHLLKFDRLFYERFSFVFTHRE